MTGPLLMPARIRKSMPWVLLSWAANSAVASSMSMAARMARSGSSSWATGAPKKASIASPWSCAIVPSYRKTARDMRSNASLIIAVQSSGSICSAIEVEPTTSAKSAVTGLRSPVRRAVRILVISGAGAAAATRVCAAASSDEASVRARPQFAQNLASRATLASQRGQVRVVDSTVIRIASYRRRRRCLPPPSGRDRLDQRSDGVRDGLCALLVHALHRLVPAVGEAVGGRSSSHEVLALEGPPDVADEVEQLARRLPAHSVVAALSRIDGRHHVTERGERRARGVGGGRGGCLDRR